MEPSKPGEGEPGWGRGRGLEDECCGYDFGPAQLVDLGYIYDSYCSARCPRESAWLYDDVGYYKMQVRRPQWGSHPVESEGGVPGDYRARSAEAYLAAGGQPLEGPSVQHG